MPNYDLTGGSGALKEGTMAEVMPESPKLLD